MESRNITIPERTSSKRRLSATKEGDLVVERDSINGEVASLRKKLKPQQSFDSRYWDERIRIVKRSSEAMRMTYEIEELKYTTSNTPKRTAWENSVKAIALKEQAKSLELDEKLCEAQAKRLKEDGFAASTRRAFIKLFTASKNGLGITVDGAPPGAGRRATKDQSRFRQSLIEASNAKHPDPECDDFLWCPIKRDWFDADDSTTAAHIFSYHHGQDCMVAIFGDDVRGELFSPKNGILMSPAAEKRFDKGLFVIVPDVIDHPSQEIIDGWNNSSPKEYKIKVLDKSNNLMKLALKPEDLGRTWSNLDGQRVMFRSDHRPRARYLYFHYCLSVMRRAWAPSTSWATIQTELGQKVWATRGRYLAKGQILAFVEEIGHDVESALLQGARDPDTVVTEVDETALAAANDQIRLPFDEDAVHRSEVEPEEKAMMSGALLEETDDEDNDEDDEEKDDE